MIDRASLTAAAKKDDRATPRARQTSLRLFARAVAAFALVTAAAEIALRLFLAEPYPYVETPDRGRLPPPSSSHFQAAEGGARIHYNSLSLHSPEIGPRGPNEKRVTVLGDSLTEAVEVSDEDNYPYQLQRRLDALGENVRVINAGRMAYLAGEILHTAEILQPRIEADAAILALRPHTFGLDDNGRVMLPGFFGGSYELDAAGQVTFVPLHGHDSPFRRSRLLHTLKEHSAILDSGFTRLMEYLVPPPRETHTDWSLIRRRADYALAALTRLFRGRVIVVMITNREAIGEVDGVVEEPAERVIREAAAAAGLPFWSTRDVFNEELTRRHRLANGFSNVSPPGYGHLNPYGHAVVAEHLAPMVMEMLR